MLVVYLFLPIIVIGSLLVGAAIRSASTEATRLGQSIDGLHRLQPAMVEVRSETERTRQAIERLRQR